MTPIRVLHVITGLTTGGAEVSLLKLIESLHRERFVHIVVSLTGKGVIGERIEALGVPVIALRLSRWIAPLTGPTSISRVIARTAPDLVQGWMYHANLLALLAVKLARHSAPVLWNIRASLDGLENEKRSTRAIIRTGAPLSRLAAGIGYNSATSARQHEGIGYSVARTRIIPNGFDCTALGPDESARMRLRSSLGLGDESVLVGCIGRYHPIKGYDDLLAAAAQAVRVDARLHFVLVGSGVDSKNDRLASRISSLELDAFVHCLGERDDVPAVLAGLDILCSASVGESFPNAVGEAMACAVPCVATDAGDSRALVGSCGVIVPRKDPAALAQGVLSLTRMNPGERRALGAAAREKICEHYSLAAVAGLYERWYEQIAL